MESWEISFVSNLHAIFGTTPDESMGLAPKVVRDFCAMRHSLLCQFYFALPKFMYY